jgi:hypothetical protein
MYIRRHLGISSLIKATIWHCFRDVRRQIRANAICLIIGQGLLERQALSDLSFWTLDITKHRG